MTRTGKPGRIVSVGWMLSWRWTILPATPQQDVDQMISSTLVDRPDLIAAIGKVTAAEAQLQGAEAAYRRRGPR